MTVYAGIGLPYEAAAIFDAVHTGFPFSQRFHETLMNGLCEIHTAMCSMGQ